jgi:streptogramin lyase
MSAALARIEGNTWKIFEPSFAILYGSRDSRGITWLLDSIPGPNRIPVYQVLRLEKRKLTVAAQTRDVSRDFGFGTTLAVDHAGTLWLGAGARGLFFLKNGAWEQFETPPEVAGKRAQVTFTDPGGRVWFGFSDSAILRMDGKSVRTFSAKDGLQVGSIKRLRAVTVISGSAGKTDWLFGKKVAFEPWFQRIATHSVEFQESRRTRSVTYF